MKVVKRGNRGTETVKFDKITARLKALCRDLSPAVDPILITKRTIDSMVDGIHTNEIDDISANVAEVYGTHHHHYLKLAARIRISNLHKMTPSSFSKCMLDIQQAAIDITTNTTKCVVKGYNQKAHLPFNMAAIEFIKNNAEVLDRMINHSNDYKISNMGIKTLMHNYLQKIKVNADRKVPKVLYDRPQYMFMRVAVALYMNYSSDYKKCINSIKKCYKRLSSLSVVHASPTLFNACAEVQQLLSCFLLGTHDDIDRIMTCQRDASIISKFAGGIGVHMHQIRSMGSYIHGTGGESNGLVPQLKQWNELAKTWNQGGRRKGSIAIYLEPYHGDIMKFLELKRPVGKDEDRAHDLFYGLWLPDLFMKRLISSTGTNGSSSSTKWSLFSDNEAKNLSVVYDGMPIVMYEKLFEVQKCSNDEYKCNKCSNCNPDGTLDGAFEDLYCMYENKGLAVAEINIGDIAREIYKSQRESGGPYICYKDHVNRKSNQANIGTIQSSNLCTEIMEYSDADSFACCTLMSLNLPKYINKSQLGDKDSNGIYINIDPNTIINYKLLHKMTRQCVRNLNYAIDANHYPISKCADNNYSYRPIAIGIQGLADLFCKLRIPFISETADRIDLNIIETIYHAALTESCKLASKLGPYDTFVGSPASKGKLQFDLWRDNKQVMFPCEYKDLFSGMYDWDALKEKIKTTGLRNSLLVAPMPTVSTSQIMGNGESFEPFHSNMFMKNTIGGRINVINKHMIKHLYELNLWNEATRENLITTNGSLYEITELPVEIREIYKTIWEISQMELVIRTAKRGAFVDQSQSFNIHLNKNSDQVLRSVMRATWEYGLKTGSYYIRTKAAVEARKSVMKNIIMAPPTTTDDESVDACPIGCTSCSG
jgi:ribonucleoside-diphosphate reductase alpha chain